MNYTKDDWEAIYYEELDCWGVETKEHQICGLEPGSAASGNLPKQEYEANAHIIAAAPRMYKALKSVMSMGTIVKSYERDKALEALAKAEGTKC